MPIKALTLLLGFISSIAMAAPSKGREFQSKILQLRVQEIMNSRMTGLATCMGNNRGYSLSEHQKIRDQIKAFNTTRFSTQQEILLKTIELLSLTERHPKCAAEVREADRKLKKTQTKKFDIAIKGSQALCLFSVPGKNAKCLAQVATIVAELDPFCVTQNSENLFGVKDPNPCMAGDRLLGKVMRESNDSEQALIKEFMQELDAKVTSAKNGSTVNLWDIFFRLHSDNAENRKKMLGLMAIFYYAMGSAGGYIDGIGDHYWMSAFKEQHKPEEVFTEFYNFRQKIDWYGGVINKKAKAKGLVIKLKHVNIEGMNRHDFMSMFLGCQLRNHGEMVAKVLPKLLGYGYESLDFVSHIKEDVSVKQSIKNFSTDTARYTKGTSLGNGFCNYKY